MDIVDIFKHLVHFTPQCLANILIQLNKSETRALKNITLFRDVIIVDIVDIFKHLVHFTPQCLANILIQLNKSETRALKNITLFRDVIIMSREAEKIAMYFSTV